MSATTVFTRTRKGGVAMSDESVPMSAGFRRLLGLINGKRDSAALLTELPHLDSEDLALWTLELLRQGFIASKDNLAAEETAFSLTTEMPTHMSLLAPGTHGTTVDAGALIDSITADVSRGINPAANAATEKKLARTARLAVIESVTSYKSVEGAGFFIYPDAAQGLPADARTCIATHDAAQSKLLTLLVKRAGGAPEPVDSRDALLAMLRSHTRAHVLFLDADLPGIDGFRALEAIRAKPAMKSMRVVLIAAQGERADLARALMLGATGYIVKPLTREVMNVALPQIFGRGAGK